MNWRRPLSIIAFCLMASNAMAELNFNGFLSVGAGALVDDDEVTEYEGFDGDWSTDPDTVFALQLSAPISDKVTATGQLIARGQDDYSVEAEWAYLAYAVNENWDVRVGRLRAPFFLYSDFLDVGYTYPWIRPPSRTYRIPFSSVEGMDTLYRSNFGDWDSTLQAFYGRFNDDLDTAAGSLELDLVGFTGINWTVNKDWLTMRFGMTDSELSLDTPAALQPLIDGLTLAGFPTVAEALVTDDLGSRFYSAAIAIDYNDWLLTTEGTWAIYDGDNTLSDTDTVYVMVGRRFGAVTVHASYDHSETDPDSDFVNAIPAGVAPALDGLRAAAASVVTTDEFTDVTIGLRYDFAPSTAFKFDVTRTEDEVTGDKGTLVSFAFDLVF